MDSYFLDPKAELNFPKGTPVVDSAKNKIGEIVSSKRDSLGARVTLDLDQIPDDLRVLLQPPIDEIKISFSIAQGSDARP